MESIKILDLLIPDYTEKFLSGQFGSEEMPLLKAIGNLFEDEIKTVDLQNVYIVACQHLLLPQLEMFKLFVKLGFVPSQIFILPKIYSANESIFSELKNLGCTMFEEALTFQPSQAFDDFHSNQCKNVVTYVSKNVSREAKLIILDDGGMLLKSFAEQQVASSFKGGVYGVEQTASGKNILLKQKLPFIVTSVASSIEKITIETNYIIRHCMVRIEQYFSEKRIQKSVKILVLGKGPIGKTLISELAKNGYSCDGYDITERNCKVFFRKYDVIVGATGNNSLTTKQLDQLKEGTHLISVSSSDREFPSIHIRNNSMLGVNVHDTFIYNKNNIHLVNGGFPITFKGNRIECFPLEMDVTKMKLTEAVLLHVLSKIEVSTSVNDLYGESKLVSSVSFLKLWVILFCSFLLLKIFHYGLVAVPPLWIQFVLLLFFLLGSIPALWHIMYHKRVESFL